jgi:hypothetical protein
MGCYLSPAALQRCVCSKLIRMDNVPATFAMGVNNQTPTISGSGAAIAT